MAFPRPSEIKKILRKLEKAEGTLALTEKPTTLEKFRWDICQKFVRYKLAHGCSQKHMAELLNVDEAKISKILHHRIDEFSTDRLIALYELLDPGLKLRVG